LNAGTPVQRRWTAATEHLDRTNVALDKRLSLIQELNHKILASHDKMETAHRKSRWKSRVSPAEKRQESLGLREQPQPPAEKKRALGERMNFRRRAGGEWSLPEQLDSGDRGVEESEKERDLESVVSKSSPRLERVMDRGVDRGLDRGLERRNLELEASTSQSSWAEKSRGSEDESAQERSVLRELNEAIDRFEEEAGGRPDDSKISTGHDSSWDSGVGGELSSCVAGKTGTKRGTGWLRVQTGIESSLVYLTLETSAADVCRDMLLSDNHALYIQVTFLLPPPTLLSLLILPLRLLPFG
jgi:hypothetical protein